MARAITIKYSISGPFFERLRKGGMVLDEANRKWVETLIREGEAKVQTYLYPGHGQDTGEFKRTIHSMLQSSRHGIVGIEPGARTAREAAIIGNWLEGSKSRHERHRFRGYFMWRKTRTHLRRVANEIAGRVYSRATKRLT